MITIFKTIGDLRKTIRELKSSLTYLREIFAGLLRISQDIEELTSEAKCLVEFYGNESRSTIRDQLHGLMTSEANDELYHKDLFNYLQNTVNMEISRFLCEYNYHKQAMSVTLKILQRLHRKVENLKLKDYENIGEQKKNVLEKFDVFLRELSQSLEKTSARQHEKVNADDEDYISIRLFCDQQKISESLEQTLDFYFITQDTCGYDSTNGTSNNSIPPLNTERRAHKKEFLFRERVTRIRKLRHYLSSKIKLKKIGKYYREEISLQIQLDLKEAAENLQDHEELVHCNIKTCITGLRQLPKYHFKEMVNQERMSEAKATMESLIENDLAFEVENLVRGLNVGEKMNSIEQRIVRKGNEFMLDVRGTQHMKLLLTALKKVGINEDAIFPVLQKIVRQNLTDLTISAGTDTDGKIIKDVRSLTSVHFTKAITSLPGEVHHLLKQNREQIQEYLMEEITSRNKYARNAIQSILYLDRDAITGDVTRLVTPLFKMAAQVSSRVAVFVIDKSFFATFSLVDTLTTVVGVLKDAGTIPDKDAESLFLGSLVRFMPNACQEDVRRIVYFSKALHQRKSLRQRFLKEVEVQLTATIQQKGERCLGKRVETHLVRTIQKFACVSK